MQRPTGLLTVLLLPLMVASQAYNSGGGSGTGATTPSSGSTTTQFGAGLSNKQKVINILASINKGNNPFPPELAYIAQGKVQPNLFVQHNQDEEDGIQGTFDFISAINKNATINTIRAFTDGDIVWAHTDYFIPIVGGKVFGVDVFRFDPITNLIIEHWDNLASTPANPNPSGHTVLDGPTVAVDLDKTQANKALVQAYTQYVLVGGNLTARAQFFNGNSLIQHNSNWADGLDGMDAGMAALAAAGSAQTYTQLHQVHGEGNFVLVMSEGLLGTAKTGIYDIYRVDNGKIVEHWDVFGPILPPARWGNPNGKFSVLTI